MTKYFVVKNDDFPDDAHRFWLRKDQYTIGELFVDEKTANWIASQLGDETMAVHECHDGKVREGKLSDCVHCNSFYELMFSIGNKRFGSECKHEHVKNGKCTNCLRTVK